MLRRKVKDKPDEEELQCFTEMLSSKEVRLQIGNHGALTTRIRLSFPE
jgi:hypothetical protein